jgi:hypothetical protein
MILKWLQFEFCCLDDHRLTLSNPKMQSNSVLVWVSKSIQLKEKAGGDGASGWQVATGSSGQVGVEAEGPPVVVP